MPTATLPQPGTVYLNRKQNFCEHTVELYVPLDPEPHWFESRKDTTVPLFHARPGVARGQMLTLNVPSHINWVQDDALELLELASRPQDLLVDRLGSLSPLQRGGVCVMRMPKTALNTRLVDADQLLADIAQTPYEMFDPSGVRSVGAVMWVDSYRKRTIAVETNPDDGTVSELGQWLSTVSWEELGLWAFRGGRDQRLPLT